MPNVLLSESIAVELGASEPWPEDVKLFQTNETEQILLPDRANSRSVQAFLKICSLDFEVEIRTNAEEMSPSGQIPFIRCGSFVLAEMDKIVSFINNKGINLSLHLSPSEKADMQAYITLVDTVFNSAELYVSWCHKDILNEVTYPRYSYPFPWPLDKILCWQKKRTVHKKLHSLGWSEKTFEEVLDEVADCCQALSDRLNNTPYFFGDRPTELDALVYGHLSAILATPLPDNSLAGLIRDNKKLVELCQLIAKTYFDDKI